MTGGATGLGARAQHRHVERRARPALGTLVEVGIDTGGLPRRFIEAAFAAAFDRIGEVEACLSRFRATSDIGRFNAAEAGTSMVVGGHARTVLDAARALHDASDGLFDVSLGSGPAAWRCDGKRLHKLDAAVSLDLGGIGKGYAIDCAVTALAANGVTGGWVNAGGDLRAFGPVAVPVDLRDEYVGGVRRFGVLSDGALATSLLPRIGAGNARRDAGRTNTNTHMHTHTYLPPHTHVSVAAGRCMAADALTKVVALSNDASHPLLARHGAQAWLHAAAAVRERAVA